MASSRLEKIGTIYTRINGLIKTGAMKWQDRPLWYDVYEAFPPLDEPRYDRPAPDIEVKPILYEEDVIRARFQKENHSGVINLINSESKTRTKRFLEHYHTLSSVDGMEQGKIYEEALNLLQKEYDDFKLQAKEKEEPATLAQSFKEAQTHQPLPKIDISKVMQDT